MHIYVTKIGVLGDMTPEMGCNINKLPKMHTLCRVDIRQSIYPQNWFTGAICDVTKKPKKTKKDSICSVAKWVLVVTTMSLVVISFKFCKKKSVVQFPSCERSKSAISHCTGHSLIQQQIWNCYSFLETQNKRLQTNKGAYVLGWAGVREGGQLFGEGGKCMNTCLHVSTSGIMEAVFTSICLGPVSMSVHPSVSHMSEFYRYSRTELVLHMRAFFNLPYTVL